MSEAEVQRDELARVRSRLRDLVIRFCQAHSRFHMADLQAFIAGEVLSAPDSPSRILRDLRQRGVLDYEVTSRRGSEYRVLDVRLF